MGIFKTPKAPDPYASAAAQAGANRDGAIATQLVNMIDQETPDGNLTYTKNGTRTYFDTTANKDVTLDTYKATQTLNPTQQAAKDQEQQVDLKTNTLAGQLLGNAQGQLATPADFSDAAIKAKTDAMINPRLADRFSRDEAALRTQLINRGMREGTQGFNDAMLSFNQGKSDAYSSEGLNNRQQAIQELGMGRDRAINEIGALMGTGQIASPQFTSTPRANVDATPIAQLINDNYKSRVSNANARMGGLFGLGGSLISAGSKFATGGF